MSDPAVDPAPKRAARVLTVRRAAIRVAPKPAPKAVKRLGNPVRELYGEVTNLQATWVDAVFWFVLGVLGNALGEMIWDAMKGIW